MYSSIKSVRYLVAALKAYDIRNIVIAPGGSDIPIIHSIETDSYFECYSGVDERSLVYFAIGLSQIKNEAVACVCTSGTAVSNFLPGMTEAFYQDVPIVAITADKNPYRLDHLEIQKIRQDNIFQNVVKASVDLPLIESGESEKSFLRELKITLAQLRNNGQGPVHINLPIIEDFSVYDEAQLPDIQPIQCPNLLNPETWKTINKKIDQFNKIMIIAGQSIGYDDEFIDEINSFVEKYNCVVICDYLSNLHCKKSLNAYPVLDLHNSFTLDSSLVPDLIISFGNNLSSYVLKPFLRKYCQSTFHIEIDDTGRFRDPFDSLSILVDCDPFCFFKEINKINRNSASGSNEYFNQWKKSSQEINLLDFDLSSFRVAKELASRIPDNSILHVAILNSTRLIQLFDLPSSVKVFSNIGALGIDGCLSSFIGQSAGHDGFSYCLIGDLSFFYDMNALGIRNISNNARIILLNNQGGSEFHYLMGKEVIPTINNFISAKHFKTAYGWVVSLGFDYYGVTTLDELTQALDAAIMPSDNPIFIEVFLDMEQDAMNLKEIITNNEPKTIKGTLHGIANKTLSRNTVTKIKKIMKK